MLREADAAFTIDLAAVPGAGIAASLLAMGGLEAVPGPGIVERLLGMGELGADYRAMTEQLLAQGSRIFPAVGKAMVDEDAVISFLDDEVFTDANYLGNGLYQLPPSLVCSENDKTCADMIAGAGLRIRTAIEDDALVGAIRLDAFNEEPLRFRLTPTSLALTLDLDQMQHAFLALVPATDAGPLGVALSGQLTRKLEILGTAQARTSLTFDRALSIRIAPAGMAPNSDEAFSLSSAGAEVFSLSADGIAKTGSLAVDLGRTVFAIPEPAKGRRFEFDLPGATLNAAYTQDKSLQLTRIGLGDRSASVLVDGARAVTIDLNPDNGRVFDATVDRDLVTKAETITVTQRFDLRAAVDHPTLGDERPVYDITRVLLEGSLRTTGMSNQIEVVTGSFSIATDPKSYGFTATAGQCVTSNKDQDPNTLKPFIRWHVCTCQ